MSDWDDIQKSVDEAIERSNGFTNMTDEEVEAGVAEMDELVRKASESDPDETGGIAGVHLRKRMGRTDR